MLQSFLKAFLQVFVRHKRPNAFQVSVRMLCTVWQWQCFHTITHISPAPKPSTPSIWQRASTLSITKVWKNSTLYLEITATLQKSSAGQEGEGKASLSFWLAAGIKKCTKSAMQRPSARDKYTICKTRTAEVYTLGVCTERMKAHLCSCQYTHGSSRSQMAGNGAVLIRLSGAAKIDNYTPQCQKRAAMHQQK